MVFSSLFFLFAFLPVNLLCYRLVPGMKGKNMVLLSFSLLFYAWAGPKYLLLLLSMTFMDWLCCRIMDKSGQTAGKRKAALITAIGFDLILLGVFKYLTFILSNTHRFFDFPEVVPKIALPIGISFYTFQLISYVVDVYRRDIPAQSSYWKLLLYVSLFHQCIAGPIVRYQQVADEIDWRYASKLDIVQGAQRFVTGLAKKAMLANPCGALADSLLFSTALKAKEIIPILENRSVLSMWLGVLVYSLQIYLDFSAYSDMAIGMGRMIGFHYQENFNYPYISRSVTEFWRRWHMSLSSFFRDYVYIPLGGSRCSTAAHLRNLAVVWLLTGFWHGANWNYLLWGGYYLVLLLLEKYVFRSFFDRLPSLLRRGYLLLAVGIGWLIFRVNGLSCLITAFRSLFGLNGNPLTSYETILTLKGNAVFLLAAVFACTPIANRAYRRLCQSVQRMPILQKPLVLLQCLVPILLLILSTAALVGDQYNPFLYFKF